MCDKSDAYNRKGNVQTSLATVGVASGLLLPANSDRVAAVISAGLVNRITISSNPTAVDLAGIVIQPLAAPITLSLEHHGALVSHALYAIANAAPESIGVTEVLR